MKYNAYLNTGAVIPIELPEALHAATLIRGGWLVGETGTMVQMDAVVAMVPAAASATDAELPDHVYDGEGSLWTKNDEGTYDFHGNDGNVLTYSLARIALKFGLLAQTYGQ